MGKNSKTKQLQRYLLLKSALLQDNMEQWAMADEFLGLEQVLRADQVAALRANDITKSREIHDKRVSCLEQALKILKACPACDAHDDHKEET